MDNIAHTLAGVALAEAGLRRRTALGTAALAIGANLPDVDALTYVFGSDVDALAFRRGWTHGVLAMVVLPLALAALLVAWDRLVRRRRRAGARAPVDPGWLLALCAIGIWSHPLLDLLNTYGVRLLMPFSGRWFYGDTLFIVDPWLWLTLAGGIALARWRRRRGGDPARDHAWAERPARVAVGAFAAYALVMAGSSRIGRVIVERQAESGRPATRVMVAPVPVTPFQRSVLRDLRDQYELGALAWRPGPRYAAAERVPVRRGTGGPPDEVAIEAAARTRDGAAFISWSRFPQFTTEPHGDSVRVRMSDLRYADASGRGWASVLVVVPAGRGERP